MLTKRIIPCLDIKNGRTVKGVNFVNLNDVYEWKPYPTDMGGTLSRFSTYFKQVHERFPNAEMLFAGDLLSPSSDSQLTRGLHMVEALNRLGVKVATLGNHEFDFGKEALLKAIQASQFPWLAANIELLPESGIASDLVKPYTVVNQKGKRILVFGLLTQETLNSNAVSDFMTLHDPIETAQRHLPQWIQTEKPDAVIALTHLNIAEDRRLAQTVQGIDVILGGHDHHQLLQVVNGVPIIKVDSDARTVGHLQLNFNPTPKQSKRFRRVPFSSIVEWHYEVTALTADAFPVDTTFETAVLQKVGMNLAQLDQKVAVLPMAWNTLQSAIRGVYSPTAQQICEILRRYAQADVALLNAGGIRANRMISAGAITERDILQILPFDNGLVVLEMTKAELESVLEQGLSQQEIEPNWGGYLHFSGVIAVVNPKLVKGKRIVALLHPLTNKPLNATKRYKVALNSYLASGGNGFEGVKRLMEAQQSTAKIWQETQATSLSKALKQLSTEDLHVIMHDAPTIQTMLKPL
jgi:2',3'-cyclic-nucleotide 2'-phosphodiesterase (5'-nucleotidase family)